jgi:hypothetical protein
MWTARTRATRRVATPLAMWAFAAPAGLIAWKVFDLTVPHRNVPFALGVPALIVLGSAATRSWPDAWARRPGGRPWRAIGAIVSTVLVLASATWLAARGADTWTKPRAAFTLEQYRQARVLAAYLDTVPPDTPVVVPMIGRWRPVRALMVTVPADRYLDVRAWRAIFDDDADRFRRRLARRFGPDAIAVFLAGYSAPVPLEGTQLGRGVRILVGPTPPAELSVPPADPTEAWELIRITFASVATALLLGLGWAIAFTRFSALALVCVAPAMGFAMMALAGFAAGRLGWALGGGGGVVVAMIVGLLGWLAVLIGSRRDAPSDRPEPEPDVDSPVALFTRKPGRHLAGEPGVRVE